MATRLVVVHDELDLPSGRVKVKVGGGTAGNNGLKSIHAHLHTGDYLRVRIGIGKPPGRQPGADYVLKRPGSAEREGLAVAAQVAADAVELIATVGVEAAMNRINTAESAQVAIGATVRGRLRRLGCVAWRQARTVALGVVGSPPDR